jgi:hypothetical protein
MKRTCTRNLASIWAVYHDALSGFSKELSPKGRPGA